MSGIYQGVSEHFVLKFDVSEAGKMGKCKDLSEFERTKFCWLTDWVRGSLKLQLLSGVPDLQGRGKSH